LERLQDLINGLPRTLPFLRRYWCRHPEVQLPANFFQLLERIEDLRFRDPRAAMLVAAPAVVWANAIPDNHPLSDRLRACAEACAVWAGCSRALTTSATALQKSEAALRKAASLLLAGGATSPVHFIDLYARFAFLRVDQRDLKAALEFNNRLTEIARQGSARYEARALTYSGYIYLHCSPAKAWSAYHEAIAGLPRTERRHLFSASMGYLVASFELDRRPEHPFEILEEPLDNPPPAAKAHLNWAKAKCGRSFSVAEALFLESSNAFEDLGMPAYSTAALLDYGLLCVRAGRFAQGKLALDLAIDRFSSLGLGRLAQAGRVARAATAQEHIAALLDIRRKLLAATTQRKLPH